MVSKLHKVQTVQERDARPNGKAGRARDDSMKNYIWEPKHFQACYPQTEAGVYNLSKQSARFSTFAVII